MSILTVPIMPRARYIQNLLATSVCQPSIFIHPQSASANRAHVQLLICFAAAISLLAMWASVRLRADTTHKRGPNSNGPVPGAQVSHYNAAASINMAVWLAVIVWLVNTLVFSFSDSTSILLIVAIVSVPFDLNTFSPQLSWEYSSM